MISRVLLCWVAAQVPTYPPSSKTGSRRVQPNLNSTASPSLHPGATTTELAALPAPSHSVVTGQLAVSGGRQPYLAPPSTDFGFASQGIVAGRVESKKVVVADA